MDTKPNVITNEEWHEIIQVPEIRESWGLEEGVKPAEFASQVYGARFDFISGGPGYCGDLFILYGDCAGNPPAVLVRSKGSTNARHPNGPLQVI